MPNWVYASAGCRLRKTSSNPSSSREINNNFYEKQYFLGFPPLESWEEKKYKKAHEKKFRITRKKKYYAYFITISNAMRKLFLKITS